MKRKMLSLAIIGIFLLSSAFSVSAYWSDSYKISYKGNQSTYTNGIIPHVTKVTENAYAEFQGGYITSWSKPKARLVNSNNQPRSAWVTLDGDVVATTDDVSAVINHYYYAEVEGAWNQVGTDTMRFRYNPS